MSRSAGLACAGLTLSALLILWIGNFTDLDITLADAAFDRATQAFPLQHAWLTERFNHEILKAMLSTLATGFIVLALWDALRPYASWSATHRLGKRVVALSAIVVPSAISLLKQASASHCPWDLQRYGGAEPYIRLLERMPSGIAPGHCLPGGHASSALWLVALAVFWWPARKYTAAVVGTTMLALGIGVGWMQQLRGAHFLTHTLWSAWIACALVFAIFAALKRMRKKLLAERRLAGYNSVPRSNALTQK